MAVGYVAVGSVGFGVHGKTDDLSIGEHRKRFNFLLSRFEGVFPETDYFVHGRGGVGKAFLGAVAVDGGVVVAEKSVLDLDLSGEDVREQGEDGGEDLREVLAKIVISRSVGICSDREVRLSFGHG